jgi:AraC-like DNA-binding protein
VTHPADTFDFRDITPGVERFPGYSLPRHRHLHPYATVVLEGCFEESGYAGRIRAVAGDVLIHPALDCHANHLVSSSVTLIRLDWADLSGRGAFYRLNDIEELAKIAERDPQDAAMLLESTLGRALPRPAGRRNDWPDLLGEALTRNTSLQIGRWAEENGLSPETVSRGFNTAYGISPILFRAELRARSAWLQVTRSSERLSAIAARSGFADQAHMTRWIHRVSGASPSVWRASTGCSAHQARERSGNGEKRQSADCQPLRIVASLV